MAIFGPKDGGLPLLTQFYQLDFDPENPLRSELDKWLLLLKFRLQPPVLNPQEDEWRFASTYRGGDQEVLRCARFFPLAHRMMDLMAESDDSFFDLPQRSVLTVNLAWADDSAATQAPPLGKDDQYLRLPEPENGIWDTSDFTLGDCTALLNSDSFGGTLRPMLAHINPHNPEYDPRKPLDLFHGHIHDRPQTDTALIAELFEAAGRGRDAFRRCPTCDSVFIVGRRSDQMRCSRRCNEREATRRRYKKIKSANIEKLTTMV